MKSQTLLRIAVLAALSTGSCLGQAFTYQGLLQDGGQPANGIFDLSFGLFSAESGGTATATLQVNDLAVTNGVFTAVLDFPASSFIGAPRWIGLSVRPGTATGAFTALTPRQPVTPTPYAIHAGTVNASGLIGQVTDANLSATLSTPRAFTHPGNTFTGNGANLTGLNASQLTTGTLPVERLALGSISSALLADGAVGSPQIANGSITAQDLAPTIGLWNAIGPAVLRPTGNVAIGRDTTRVQFEVSGTMGHVQSHPHFAPADGTVLLGTYQGRTTNAAQLRFSRETPGSIYTDIGQHKEGQFVVEQNDAIRLMVRPDGRVGINTSNPGAALDVWGQMHVTEQGGIRSLGPRNTYAGMIEAWYGPNDRYGLGQLPNGITALYTSDFYAPSSIQFGQMTGADRFKSQVVIDHDGRMGIGTSAPATPLHVQANSPNAGVARFDNIHPGGFSGVYFDQTNQYRGHVGYVNSQSGFGNPGTMQIGARGSLVFSAEQDGFHQERFRINGTNGNVGIGTAAPLARLETVGDSPDSFIGASDGTGLVNFGAGGAQHVTVNENQVASYNGNNPANLYLNFSSGNVAIGSIAGPTAKLHVGGDVRATSFISTSDRNAKQNFTSVNPRDVLAKVAALPITEWSYKTLSDVRHIGPIAQDFHAAFGLGNDDKGIASVDADGVALAAIQGLNEKLGEKEVELERLRAENQGLSRRLGAIERALRLQGLDAEAK